MSGFKPEFGAFAPTLREQIIKGGYELKQPVLRSSASLTHLQLDAQAVARLRIRGRISDSVANVAEKKIVREIGGLIVLVKAQGEKS